MYKYLVIIIMVLSVASVAVADTTVPHVFSSGGEIKASEINENFETLGEELDKQTNEREVIVKANGTKIGTVMGLSFSSIYMVNPNGYLLRIKADGKLGSKGLYFTSTDCSGIAYVTGPLLPKSIIVGNGNKIYYVGDDAVPGPVDLNSAINADPESSCSESSWTPTDYIPLISNDPIITGVTITTFSTPITIERKQ